MALVESLEALVAEHDRIGSPLRSRLGAGVAAPTVGSTLSSLGLTATQEVTDLFGWHEIRDEADDKARIEWFWPAAPLRLDEAVRTYREMITIGDGALTRAEFDELVRTHDPRSSFTGFWREDWLPILYGHETYAVECPRAAEPNATSGVWRVMFHPDDGFPTTRLAGSLVAFVDRVVELFRLGGYVWNEQYGSVEPVDAIFEREGLGYDTRPWPSLPSTPPGSS